MKTKSVKLTIALFFLLMIVICSTVFGKVVCSRRQQIEANYSARMKQLYAKAEQEAAKEAFICLKGD